MNANAIPTQPGGTSRRIKVVCLVSAVFAVVALGAIGYPVVTEKGFPLDDAWIHQVVGRNLSIYGTPSFVPNKIGSGSTSAIWPFVVAVNYWLFPDSGHAEFLFFFNALLFSGVILSLLAAAVIDRLAPTEVYLVGCAALTGNFAWLVACGLEHVLFVASAFGAAVLWLADARRLPLLSAGLSGLLLGIAILTRPEAVVFVPLFLAVLAWRRRHTSEIALFLSLVAASIALMLSYNYWTSGSLLPVTYQGRRWLYFGTTDIFDIRNIVVRSIALLGAWYLRIRDYFFGGALPWLGDLGIFFLVPIFIAIGLYRLIERRSVAMLFLIALAILNIGVYCLFLPKLGHGGRYQPTAMPFVYPLCGMGVLTVLDLAMGARRRPAAAQVARVIVIVLVTIVSFASLWQWSRITRLGIDHINATHVRMGEWVRANIPPSEKVAAFDIGGIGFFGDHPLVDLGGLTDPSFLPYLFSGRVGSYLLDRNVEWVILPVSPGDTSFVGELGLTDKGISKREVVQFGSPLEPWADGYDATGHAFQRQVLYRIAPSAGARFRR